MDTSKAEQTPNDNIAIGTDSPKSAGLTYFFCLLFGWLGLHRFYVGKIGTGILMLISLGGLGLWVLVDLMFLVNNKFEDKRKRTIKLERKASKLKKSILYLRHHSVMGCHFNSNVYCCCLLFNKWHGWCCQ
jgi:hypothetical protein